MPQESVAEENESKNIEFDAEKLKEDAPKEFRELPDGTMMVHDDVEYKCYNPHEYAEVLKLEDDLFWFYDRFFILVEAHDKLRLEYQTLGDRFDLIRAERNILVKDQEYWSLRVNELKKHNANIEQSNRIVKIVMWGVIVVLAVADVVLVFENALD